MKQQHNGHLQANDGAMANCPACQEMNATRGFSPADEDLEFPPDAPASPSDYLAEAKRVAGIDSDVPTDLVIAYVLIDIAETLREIKAEMHGIRRGL